MGMQTSDDGVSLVKTFEGFRSSVYKDVAGHPTIGYGHLIKPDESFDTISEEDADALLRKDLIIAENFVNFLVKVDLTQGQFDALVDFTYNLGGGVLKNSTLLKCLNARNYEGAADNFQKWVFAAGVKQAGLERRRAAEWALFTGNQVN